MAAPENETAAPTGIGNGGKGVYRRSDNTDRQPTRQARWAERNPLKTWAHSATRSAIRRGLLVRPDRCDECHTVGHVDAHHDPERYREPLHVTAWWCRSCHVKHHARQRKAGGK